MNSTVIGNTNTQNIYIYSKIKPFQIDSYVQIMDEQNNNPIGKIIDTYSVKTLGGLREDISVNLGTLNNNEEIYLGILKIEVDLKFPIKTMSKVEEINGDRLLKFLNLKDIDGLPIGVINGTEFQYNSLENKYKDLMELQLDKNTIISQNRVPIIFPYKKFNEYPGILIVGSSGSGKSYAMKSFLEEFSLKKIPMIVFDPHNELDISKNCKIFTIGNNLGQFFTNMDINEIIFLMKEVQDLSDSMENTLRNIYEKGEMLESLTNRLIKLNSIHKHVEGLRGTKTEKFKDLEPDEILFYERNKNLVSNSASMDALIFRLQSLKMKSYLRCELTEFEECLNSRNICIIRGSSKEFQEFGAYLFSYLNNKRKNYVDSNKSSEKIPPFIILMDEAHNYVSERINSGLKNIMRKIAQEGRKYGLYQIFATQRPSLLDQTIIAQMATKIIFRLNNHDDLETIRKETDLNNVEIERLNYLETGSSFLSSPIIGRTLSIKFRKTLTKNKIIENPFDELEDFGLNEDELDETIKKLLPIEDLDIVEKFMILKEQTYISDLNEFKEKLNNMVKNGKIQKEETMIYTKYY